MDATVLLLLVTLILELLMEQGRVLAVTSDTAYKCTNRDVNFALYACHTQLADITTAILHETSTNYTHVCTNFENYMICVEPNIRGCGQSKLMARYRDKVQIYSTSPYNCSIPDTSGLSPTLQKQKSLSYTLHSQGTLVYVNRTYSEAMKLTVGGAKCLQCQTGVIALLHLVLLLTGLWTSA